MYFKIVKQNNIKVEVLGRDLINFFFCCICWWGKGFSAQSNHLSSSHLIIITARIFKSNPENQSKGTQSFTSHLPNLIKIVILINCFIIFLIRIRNERKKWSGWRKLEKQGIRFPFLAGEGGKKREKNKLFGCIKKIIESIIYDV
jgi:hypothetical protein